MADASDTVDVFLCGDVMLGRGIDQILPEPVTPTLHEDYLHDARDYVTLAEKRNGPIPRAVTPDYVWGDALAELNRTNPAARIINLETAVTRSDTWVNKGINYRMSPAHIGVLTSARIDVCSLANNHVLDWGNAGLTETLDSLRGAGLQVVGAGRDAIAAAQPATVFLPEGGRVLVFGYGHGSSGIPRDWAADADKAGVNRLTDLSMASVRSVKTDIDRYRQEDDLVVVSLHWGSNWGYEVSAAERRFAHALIETADADVVHGHSSHHPRGLEVHGGKLILYGCGDFLNDYEGIGGEEAYRPDLVLMYVPTFRLWDKRLATCRLIPMQIRKFRLNRPSTRDMAWLATTMRRESARLGTDVVQEDDRQLRVAAE